MKIEYVVFDVDDVVIDTDAAGAAAEASVYEPLSKHLSAEQARRATDGLAEGYEILRRQLRSPAGEVAEEYTIHLEKIRRWQRGVLEAGHEIKQWSRDSLLAIALEECGAPVFQDVVTSAVDRYWSVLAQQTRVTEDAKRLISLLQSRGIAVHLATNSDGFLVFDESSRSFRYDPEDAVKKKIARLGKVSELGLSERDISVGDPIGKPKAAFFEKTLAELGAKLGKIIDVTRVYAVGDSLTNDVLPLVELGAAGGAWLVRKNAGRAPTVLADNRKVTVVGSLDDLRGVLSV
jgi:FMN phosphatase YigB (HAD superfamily)